PIRITDWAYLEIPMVKVTVSGKNLESIGVEPDVAIPNEFDSEGKDLCIETALSHLATQQKGTTTPPMASASAILKTA
ncbi:MAG: hypothetical protein QXI19_09100, partial [Candidatus Caldarchaeum sp.]